jgi:hypothetical protein
MYCGNLTSVISIQLLWDDGITPVDGYFKIYGVL